MTQVHEIFLKGVSASFFPNKFDVHVGFEKESVETDQGSVTDWVAAYARVDIGYNSLLITQAQYEEVEEAYSDKIGELLWVLT